MTRRQVSEEVRSLAVRWVKEVNPRQGDRITGRQVSEEVRSLAVRWGEEVPNPIRETG